MCFFVSFILLLVTLHGAALNDLSKGQSLEKYAELQKKLFLLLRKISIFRQQIKNKRMKL